MNWLRSLSGLRPIANKGGKWLGACNNSKSKLQQGCRQDRVPALQGYPQHPAHPYMRLRSQRELFVTLHLPASRRACRVKEVNPPNVPGVSPHLHPLWNSACFSMLRKTCTQHGICRVTAVGSRLSPGNYLIVSLSTQSCKLITFIADFVYTCVY